MMRVVPGTSSEGDRTSGGWAAVGRAIGWRIVDLGLTKVEVTRRSGISDTTINRYIGGQPIAHRNRERALALALEWPVDTFDRIRGGVRPEQIEQLGEAAFSGNRDRLAAIEGRLEAIEALLTQLVEGAAGQEGTQ